MSKPDKWVVSKITLDNDVVYKLVSGWDVGYLKPASWVNEGVTSVDYNPQTACYIFECDSGVIYDCHKDKYGLSYCNGMGYQDLGVKYKDATELTVMASDTNWLKIRYINREI
jgi:hypothetical protein